MFVQITVERFQLQPGPRVTRQEGKTVAPKKPSVHIAWFGKSLKRNIHTTTTTTTTTAPAPATATATATCTSTLQQVTN